MRCVNPSSATVSPSCACAATASARVTMSAISGSLGRLERELPRLALHSDPPELRELVERERATEASPTAVLDTAERHLRLVMDGLVVDVHDAGIDPVRHRHAAVCVAREDACGQPIAGRVGARQSGVGAVDDLDCEHRSEGLDLSELALPGHVRDQGCLVAAVGHRTTGEDPRAPSNRLIDPPSHSLQGTRVDERTDDAARILGIARGQALRLPGQPVAELPGNGALDNDAPCAHADLSLVEEGAEGSGVDGGLSVRVREHDQWVEAAELENNPLEV